MLLSILSVAMLLDQPGSSDGSISALDAGVSAGALVAAGGSLADAQAISDRIDDAVLLVAEVESLRRAADIAAEDAELAYEALLIQPNSASLRSEYDAAVESVRNTHARMLAAIAALKADALTGLGGEASELLARCGDPTSRGVPVNLRVAPCSAEDWSVIKHALIAERRAARRGEELDPDAAALLRHVRGDPAVVAAEVRLQTQDVEEIERTLSARD